MNRARNNVVRAEGLVWNPLARPALSSDAGHDFPALARTSSHRHGIFHPTRGRGFGEPAVVPQSILQRRRLLRARRLDVLDVILQTTLLLPLFLPCHRWQRHRNWACFSGCICMRISFMLRGACGFSEGSGETTSSPTALIQRVRTWGFSDSRFEASAQSGSHTSD